MWRAGDIRRGGWQAVCPLPVHAFRSCMIGLLWVSTPYGCVTEGAHVDQRMRIHLRSQLDMADAQCRVEDTSAHSWECTYLSSRFPVPPPHPLLSVS